MPTVTYERIWRAVRKREPLSFSYEDRTRDVYPIVLGYAADGREALLAFQSGGETSPRNKLPGWRCFYLTDIRELTSRKGGWREGASHKQDQTCVRFVDVDVNIPGTLTRPRPLPFGSQDLRYSRAK